MLHTANIKQVDCTHQANGVNKSGVNLRIFSVYSILFNGSYLVLIVPVLRSFLIKYIPYFQYFVMDVVVNFSRLSEDDLYTQLDRIATKADEEVENAELVGILTAGSRDKWAAIRMQLMEGHFILNIWLTWN